jgi:hypothetical protein
MADFSDTITLAFSMNGRAFTFNYTQTITDPNNVIRYNSDFGIEGGVTVAVTNAAAIFVGNRSKQKPLQVNISDGADGMFGVYLEAGSIIDFYEGSGGGMYGKDTANIVTFLDPTSVIASALSAGETNVDVLVLNYAS